MEMANIDKFNFFHISLCTSTALGLFLIFFYFSANTKSFAICEWICCRTMRIIRCGNFSGKNLDMLDKNLYMWRLNRLYEFDRTKGIWCGWKLFSFILNIQLAHHTKKIHPDAFFAARTFTRVADIKCLIFKIQFLMLSVFKMPKFCLLKFWF